MRDANGTERAGLRLRRFWIAWHCVMAVLCLALYLSAGCITDRFSVVTIETAGLANPTSDFQSAITDVVSDSETDEPAPWVEEPDGDVSWWSVAGPVGGALAAVLAVWAAKRRKKNR